MRGMNEMTALRGMNEMTALRGADGMTTPARSTLGGLR
jgi:hypothetical protein